MLFRDYLDQEQLPLLIDHQREADDDNPKGYYEFEEVKTINKDNSWLNLAKGKVVKIVSPLLKYLSDEFNYKIIFIERDLNEVLASQKKMLKNRDTEDQISDSELINYFEEHLSTIKSWLANKTNIEVVYIDYNKILKGDQEYLKKIKSLLGEETNLEKMKEVVDQRLYRNQSK